MENRKTPIVVIAERETADGIPAEYLSNAPDNDMLYKASRLVKKAAKQSLKKAVHYIKIPPHPMNGMKRLNQL